MEALLRLRVLIWLLLLFLWAIMVYQYLGQEDISLPPVPFASVEGGAPSLITGGGPRSPIAYESKTFPSAETASSELPIEPASPQPPSSLDYVKAPPVPPQATAPPQPIVKPQLQKPIPSKPTNEEEISETNQSSPVPPGFIKTETRHFLIYSEGESAPQNFLSMVELLHGNLMLDLASFSPWADDERVSIYLFQKQETYREMTGRPAWSGGATSVSQRKIFIYASGEMQGILAHELCHIYYDGFYLNETSDPLWLSEGMATLIQVERGLSAPNWLHENLKVLEKGGGYSLPELMAVNTLSGASDDRVRMWYSESYSIVRFLVRLPPRSSFYKFSKEIRDGRNVTAALYAAYGMPYNRIKALEYAWRYNLIKRSLSSVNTRFQDEVIDDDSSSSE